MLASAKSLDVCELLAWSTGQQNHAVFSASNMGRAETRPVRLAVMKRVMPQSSPMYWDVNARRYFVTRLRETWRLRISSDCLQGESSRLQNVTEIRC
jgi:hypothetical protein